ncbi:hypothetical protein QAD02_006134 [Eretmocerus hayati]|uniref:Uncharacterized protein n=1 Tax=Eretmocerus hayati TaxID=131215 RepID=A0ACC2N097_9HYME|nr:hypothetical protein QAD02_006134 [Eretmocerus hayati]
MAIFHLLYICLVLFGPGCCVNSTISREKRVIGGSKSSIAEHPYIVSLQINNTHKCGGTMLSARVVLTTAHCTEKFGKSDDIRVEAGHSKLAFGEDRPRVIDFHRHENYTLKKNDGKHDIALLKLDSDIFINNVTIRTVTLFDKNDDVNEGEPAIVMGWGLVFYEFINDTKEIPKGFETRIQKFTFELQDDKGREKFIQGLLSTARTDELMSSTVRIISKESCSKLTNMTILNEQFCASEEGKNICTGDSGGPLMIKGRQAGIISWSQERMCPRTFWPEVYMNIATYRSWIDRTKEKLMMAGEDGFMNDSEFTRKLVRIKKVKVRMHCSELTREDTRGRLLGRSLYQEG